MEETYDEMMTRMEREERERNARWAAYFASYNLADRTVEVCRIIGHVWGAAPVCGTVDDHEVCGCGTERWVDDNNRRRYGSKMSKT